MNPMIVSNSPQIATRMSPRRHAGGFSLIELMVAVLIMGILASIAYPTYLNSVTRAHRAAAEACLANYTTYMERYYTTNMRYDQTVPGGAMMTTAVLQGLNLDCASDQNTGQHYSYSFPEDMPTATEYTIQAVPIGTQATRDAGCGTLTMTHTGERGAGPDGVDKCW